MGVYYQATNVQRKKRRTTTMAPPSLRLSPSALHYAWQKNVLAASSRRTVISSIRFQSTDVSQGAKNTLPWSEYLSIRRGKRKWEMVSFSNLELLSGRCDQDSFSLPGVDHTVRPGRISWRCRVLWLNGAGCNETYHGARTSCSFRLCIVNIFAGD